MALVHAGDAHSNIATEILCSFQAIFFHLLVNFLLKMIIPCNIIVIIIIIIISYNVFFCSTVQLMFNMLRYDKSLFSSHGVFLFDGTIHAKDDHPDSNINLMFVPGFFSLDLTVQFMPNTIRHCKTIFIYDFIPFNRIVHVKYAQAS